MLLPKSIQFPPVHPLLVRFETLEIGTFFQATGPANPRELTGVSLLGPDPQKQHGRHEPGCSTGNDPFVVHNKTLSIESATFTTTD
jgi:hypothetical protein